MAAPTEVLRIAPLGGMDDRHRAQPHRGALVRDLMWTQRGAWVDGPGFRVITRYDDQGTPADAFVGHPAVRSIHWFAQGNGAVQWLVWETEDGELIHFVGAGAYSTADPWSYIEDAGGNSYNGTARSRYTSGGPGTRTMSLVWGDNLYLVNGQNAPLVFNGRYVERAGFAGPPPRPEVSIVSAAGTGATDEFSTTLSDLGIGSTAKTGGTASSAYKYKVAFLNERGQWSPWSEASDQVIFENTASARRGARVTIPIGASNTVARAVARTRDLLDSNGEPLNLGYAENFYMLRIIQDNGCEVFEDWVPDNGLGSLVDEADYGAWPLGADVIAEFKGTMFAANSGGNLLFYSRPTLPEVFPPDNVFSLSDGHGGPITAMQKTRNALVVFRRRAIHIIKGNPTTGFYAETLTVRTGCVAGRSVKEVPGLGLMFLGDDGVWLLQGAFEDSDQVTGLRPMSTPISSWVERFTTSALANAVGAVDLRNRCYWLAVPVDGEADNSLVLRYHYDIGEWSYSENWPIADMIVTGDHRAALIFGSHDTNVPGIHVVSRGWDDKGGAASIAPLYESVPLRFGPIYGAVPLHRVNLSLVGMGSNFKVDVRLNQHYELSLLAATMVDDIAGRREDTQDLGWTYETFATTTLLNQSKKWGKYRPVVKGIDLSTMHDSHAQEAQIRIEPTKRRAELIGYDLEVISASARRVRPLSAALEVKQS